MKRLIAFILLSVWVMTTLGEAEVQIVFDGYNPVMEWDTMVVSRDGKYYMDGEEMEILRHPNMPKEGLALTMKNRVGQPNIYWLILEERIDMYLNCETGPCKYKRSVFSK